ncbi:unnamed protein product [Peniophora sp. CBMAI 1063]|nr:unnamed protein product [Peniophora sp. CBMAI 1063]
MSSIAKDSHLWDEETRRAALAKHDNSEAYSPSPDELEFLKIQTGITDEEQLKARVQDVQRRAYAVYPYVCIHRFAFTRLKIANHFAYPQLLALPKSRPRAIFLEVGCCFGQDLRKAIADGYPAKDTIASDLRQGFWDVGLDLFTAVPPPPFVQADVFELNKETSAPTPEPPADLSTLTSLTPLRAHVAAIHASSVFHLFDFEQQEAFARALASLLSNEPGSMIFGVHSGQPVKKTVKRLINGAGEQHAHSPDSWREMWEGIYGEGVVKVESRAVERPDAARIMASTDKVYHLVWCVTRL